VKAFSGSTSRSITQDVARILCPKSKPLNRLSIQTNTVASIPFGPVIPLHVEHNFAVAEAAMRLKESQ
jgi:hypothetical protein